MVVVNSVLVGELIPHPVSCILFPAYDSAVQYIWWMRTSAFNQNSYYRFPKISCGKCFHICIH